MSNGDSEFAAPWGYAKTHFMMRVRIERGKTYRFKRITPGRHARKCRAVFAALDSWRKEFAASIFANFPAKRRLPSWVSWFCGLAWMS